MKDLPKISKKENHQLIISAVLVLIFIYLFTTNVLLRKKPGSSPPAPTAQTAATDPTQGMSEQVVLVTNMRLYDKLRADREKIWEREWGRDPFVPQETGSAFSKAVNLTLNGILWDETNPKAIVNEKTLIKGDTIYGYTVTEIRQRSVILRTGEKNIELQVFRPLLDGSNAKAA